ncbi:sodium:proton antiporter [Lysinibacillus sp. 3P01SB]|uniref:sodium:proton antiporter n=1 Tax=Lysinibacillus sp. 3P01SB TaxID=3132284 RepID=UPI0039A7781F
MNNLIRQETNEKGEIIYRMATFDVDVVAKSTGGLSPIIIYLQGEKDITDDIRALRFHYQNPASFIEDYPAFQAMLYEKEQRAINELYESISIKPKNLSPAKQVLWSFGVMLFIVVPFIIAALVLK